MPEEDALELHFRLGMGQIDTLDQHVSFMGSSYDIFEIRESYKQIKQLVFPELQGGYYGIRNENVHESCKIGCEIRDVIRHRLAWDRKPEGGWEMCYHEPMNVSQKELPKIYKDGVADWVIRKITE